MDKYDYITATIPEELDRVEKVIKYLEDNNINDSTLVEYRERYNNIKKYLNAKEEYNDIETIILEDKDKMNKLITMKEEAEVDNILLEDTLLNKFHEDTNSKYKNILYENIKYEDDDSIKDILYLLFEKESDYSSLIVKRNKLKNILDKNKYPNTYNTLISQSILIDKEDSVLDEIFILENNMKIEEDKLDKIESSVMTEGILKILYEFWIVDSYDRNKVDKKKIFKDNRSLVSIKNTLNNSNTADNNKTEKREDNLFPDLNLPGLNEDTLININGRDYIK